MIVPLIFRNEANSRRILYFLIFTITIDALYDYTLYVRGAYNHRITNSQRIIPSYDETEFTAHLLLPHPPGH